MASGSRVRRDHLVGLEREMQKLWEVSRTYEADAEVMVRGDGGKIVEKCKKKCEKNGETCEQKCEKNGEKCEQKCEKNKEKCEKKCGKNGEKCGKECEKNAEKCETKCTIREKEGKFFCTFPYPYMNGKLHLGHAFTLTKSEFQARFQRMLNKNVLWPFGFHCTGMPIPACADKIKRELREEDENLKKKNFSDEESETLPDSFKGKKSKAANKTDATKGQCEIMRIMGVPEEEIEKFGDPNHWLEYFPPLAIQDLKLFGVATDWRRSFITTNANPYYDAFIRWHFNVLKSKKKIHFGLRPAIVSPQEKQPCADHDRASGEGVGPQEQTLIKMKVQKVPEDWKSMVGEKKVYFVAATLRPETMYGQTNCFVLPTGDYGFYLVYDKPNKHIGPGGIMCSVLDRTQALQQCSSLFVCSAHCALNMIFQGLAPMDEGGKAHCLGERKGMELIGTSLSSPRCSFPTIYALPMLSISMDKGSGVVTSVPGDAPDDYVMLEEIKKKKKYYEENFCVNPSWVSFVAPVPIIEVPGLGNLVAIDLVSEAKVKSYKDKALLAQAKETAYKKSFYEGSMLVGNHKGKKVSAAKTLERDDMVAEGLAAIYLEPERPVVARSGGECCVAICNQWYIEYGEEKWRTEVEDHVKEKKTFNSFNHQVGNQLQNAVGWLKEWACSRHYGLGTYLPWDQSVLIESLSDSTVYMAYYTVAHLLQGGSLNGQNTGPIGIEAKDLSDEFFNYIFTLSDSPPSHIPQHKLDKLRGEFEYWYPCDLRVSGKDLIFNHLTMCLYNHAAVWDHDSSKWPRGYFCNGHVLVDTLKMSKSLGNFLTISDCLEDFGADATRLALADGGDSLDDANFQRETANSAIMRLYVLEQFAREFLEYMLRKNDQKATENDQKSTENDQKSTENDQKSTENDDFNLKTAKNKFRDGPLNLHDRMFLNELKILVNKTRNAYTDMTYRDALKYGFFDFCTKRDSYRIMSPKMHCTCVRIFLELQAKMLHPICPHVTEYLWQKMGSGGLLAEVLWPCECTWARGLGNIEKNGQKSEEKWEKKDCVSWDLAFDQVLHRQFTVLTKSVEEFRKKVEKKKTFQKGIIYIAKQYLPWQQTVLKILQSISTESPPPTFMSLVKDNAEVQKFDKATLKLALSFASFQMKEEVKARGRSALDLSMPFDETELFESQKLFISAALDLQEIEVKDSENYGNSPDNTATRKGAAPGSPVIYLY